MLKLITRSALLLLCAGALSSCTAIYNLVEGILMIPFNILNSVLY